LFTQGSDHNIFIREKNYKVAERIATRPHQLSLADRRKCLRIVTYTYILKKRKIATGATKGFVCLLSLCGI